MNQTQKAVLEGLDLGLRRHIADLYKVLVADPCGTERFQLGLERAIKVYDGAVAIALDLYAGDERA